MCAKFLRFEGKLDTIYALNFADMLLEVLDGRDEGNRRIRKIKGGEFLV